MCIKSALNPNNDEEMLQAIAGAALEQAQAQAQAVGGMLAETTLMAVDAVAAEAEAEAAAAATSAVGTITATPAPPATAEIGE
jgi:hypothetical protein